RIEHRDDRCNLDPSLAKPPYALERATTRHDHVLDQRHLLAFMQLPLEAQWPILTTGWTENHQRQARLQGHGDPERKRAGRLGRQALRGPYQRSEQAGDAAKNGRSRLEHVLVEVVG